MNNLSSQNIDDDNNHRHHHDTRKTWQQPQQQPQQHHPLSTNNNNNNNNNNIPMINDMTFQFNPVPDFSDYLLNSFQHFQNGSNKQMPNLLLNGLSDNTNNDTNNDTNNTDNYDTNNNSNNNNINNNNTNNTNNNINTPMGIPTASMYGSPINQFSPAINDGYNINNNNGGINDNNNGGMNDNNNMDNNHYLQNGPATHHPSHKISRSLEQHQIPNMNNNFLYESKDIPIKNFDSYSSPNMKYGFNSNNILQQQQQQSPLLNSSPQGTLSQQDELLLHRRKHAHPNLPIIKNEPSLESDSMLLLETSNPKDKMEICLNHAKRSIAENLSLKQFANTLKDDTVHRKDLKSVFGFRVLLDTVEATVDNPDKFAAPKDVLYKFYAYICQASGFDSLTSSSLGKIVKALWPNVGTKRLGSREDSRYHYVGIKFKDYVKPMIDAFVTKSKLTKGRDFLTVTPVELENYMLSDGFQYLEFFIDYDDDEVNNNNNNEKGNTKLKLQSNNNNNNNNNHSKSPDPGKTTGTTTIEDFKVPSLTAVYDGLYFPKNLNPFHDLPRDSLNSFIITETNAEMIERKNKALRRYEVPFFQGDGKKFAERLFDEYQLDSPVYDLMVYYNLLKVCAVVCCNGINQSGMRRLRKFAISYEEAVIWQVKLRSIEVDGGGGVNYDDRKRAGGLFINILSTVLDSGESTVKFGKIVTDKGFLFDSISSKELINTKFIINAITSVSPSEEHANKLKVTYLEKWKKFLQFIYCLLMSREKSQAERNHNNHSNGGSTPPEGGMDPDDFSPIDHSILEKLRVGKLLSKELDLFDRQIIINFLKFFINELLLQFNDSPVIYSLLLTNSGLDKLVTKLTSNHFADVQLSTTSSLESLNLNDTEEGEETTGKEKKYQHNDDDDDNDDSKLVEDSTQILVRNANIMVMKSFAYNFLSSYAELYGLDKMIRKLIHRLADGNTEGMNNPVFDKLEEINVFFVIHRKPRKRRGEME
ncbi:hypothetical protein DASC09_053490 [Saccharomycopsis crataegensis]|uniref:RFX-type winged-helix domain-containing protein n=1 Tax=Saccharomycopsis crataegensis TaxID=43959 RepID=A0AAV5QU41_9ASCO|nr:hypothetical protein DASC09_053490 [Saccharomycopsis crataegensis]